MKLPFQFASLGKEKLKQAFKLLNAFVKSDVGKLSKRVVYLVFPELIAVEKVGVPVLRQLVKIVSY